MTTEIKNFSSFIIDSQWNKSLVLLAKSGSGWARDIIGEDVFEIFNVSVDLVHLEDWLGGIAKAIKVISLPKAFTKFNKVEKARHQLDDGHLFYRMLTIFSGVTKFIVDTFFALECLKFLGIVVLTPYLGQCRFVYKSLGVVASVFKLSQKVYDLALITFDSEAYLKVKYLNPEEEIDLTNERNKALLGIVGQTCAVSSKFFRTCKMVFDPLLDFENQMGEVPLRVLDTVRSLAKISGDYLDSE